MHVCEGTCMHVGGMQPCAWVEGRACIWGVIRHGCLIVEGHACMWRAVGMPVCEGT